MFCGLGTLLADVIIMLYYRDIFDLIGKSNPSKDLWPELFHMLIAVAVIILLFNLAWRIGGICMIHMQSSIMRDLSNLSLEKLQYHSYNFFTGNFTGSLVAKSKRFVRAFETMHDKFIFNFWQTGIALVGIFYVMYINMPKLALFFAAWCMFYFVITYFFVRFRLKFDLEYAKADSDVTGVLSDSITNILNVKMFTSRTKEMENFKRFTNKEYLARSKTWYVNEAFYTIQGISMAILEIVGMYITIRLWIFGSITTGTLIIVQSYFYAVMMRTWELGRTMSEFFKALSDASEMVEIISSPLEVEDIKNPEKCHIKEGHIKFNNMKFSYEENQNVFPNLNLDIHSKQKVGIVGHSGAGKSTLFKLILRFLDVTNGSITIDNQDIRNITQDDLRKNISYVPQDPILFHRSLYDNIAYASQNSTTEEIEEAAKKAHAHDFISELPNGYETLVGERGVKLSGGERQRIAIARVILKNAPILLLDEATSSLDSVSEKYIQEQLKEIMDTRTTIAIAHRISTIKQMDRIIVMENGEIVEDGSHDELLKKDGIYADLWSHQSQGFLIE